jgi:hypothetical protein
MVILEHIFFHTVPAVTHYRVSSQWLAIGILGHLSKRTARPSEHYSVYVVATRSSGH